MKVDREAFLLRLESVQPGVSTREPVEQANCFAFDSGRVFSYNDETTCSSPSNLDNSIRGAVKAEKLLEMVRRFPTDEMDVSIEDGYFILSGKRRTAKFVMEQDIYLPIDKVDEPEKWRKIPEGFLDAINIVGKCSSTVGNKFISACVHIHPDWVEAGDGFQVCRWPMKTGVKESNLVRYLAVKQVAHLGMTEWGQTKGWLHFRNTDGLRLSCRRYLDEYPDLDAFLAEEGHEITLPKGLVDALNLAKIFSSENKESDRVVIELKPGKLRIEGVGDSGQYSELKKVEYSGKPLSFLVAPDILIDAVNQYQDYVLTPNTLRVNTGNYIFATCLVLEEEETEQPGEDAMEDE